jgi:hypothetical protein
MFSKKRGALKTPGAQYSWKRRSKCFRRKEEPSEGKGLNIHGSEGQVISEEMRAPQKARAQYSQK